MASSHKQKDALILTIRANARELDWLHKRIEETFRNRSRSVQGRNDWTDACKAFHSLFDSLFFPGGISGWEAFLTRESPGIEAAVAYLEVDPWCFRSGYLKQEIWQKLKRAELSAHQMQRLEAAARAYLERPLRCEFWDMVRYVRWRGSEEFWQAIETEAKFSEDGASLNRAAWLVLARKNYPVRHMVYRAGRRI